MNFFSQIEGLVGENFSSAILRYLLERSPEIRDAFLAMISDVSPFGTIESRERFGSRREVTLKDSDNVGGRIDLFIETDNAVIGIENKFLAAFGDR